MKYIMGEIMFECKRLLTNNKGKSKFKKEQKNGEYIIDFSKYTKIGGVEIQILLAEINSIIALYKTKIRILVIKFEEVEFRDKLTYIILECIIYTLLKDYKICTYICYKNIHFELITQGIRDSVLINYANTRKKEVFLKEFIQRIYNGHYRKIIKGQAAEDSLDLCKLMFDIKSFLKAFNIEEQYRSIAAEVVSELADNAREHTGTDCLIDIDVNAGYRKKEDTSEYCALNIVIVNFSSKCLSDSLKEKIQKGECRLSERYKAVYNAYDIHKVHFWERYNEIDFYNITSFQDRITGRPNDVNSGGTGLTSLIKSLEENSDSHYGYVLSGSRGINFRLEYLKYNDDGWIGFNGTNDYLNQIPSEDVLLKSPTYIQGTAYNFTLVVGIEN